MPPGIGYGKRAKIKTDRPSPLASQFQTPDEKIGNDAASKYIKDKGYTESSIEAAYRAAKANKRRPKFQIGNYRDPGA